MLRLNLQVHTRQSKDSTAPILSVVRHCLNSGPDLVSWLVMAPGFAGLRKALR